MTQETLGSLELNRIYQMDAVEGMRLLPDDSVDLIVIDPPYNIGKVKRWDKWRLPLINILDSAAHRNRVTALPTRRLVGLFISSWRARKVKQEFNGVEVVG